MYFHCSHEIKRCLLLGRKAITNLDSILKLRDITNKGPSSQTYGFSSSPVWYENWTIKKDEHQRIDAFELWCWRRRWNSNTLATWCEELTHWKRPWCWERLKAGGEGDDRGWDVWMASPTRWTWVWVNFESWWWTGKPGVLQSMGSQRVRHNWATELNWMYFHKCF